MNYSEWQECYRFAEAKAKEVKDMNIAVKPYSLWNGAKGFEIQVWDERGRFLYETYHTGIWKDAQSMKNAIVRMIDRAVAEAA